MVEVTHLCTQCVDVITNPLCPHCSTKQVFAWLRDRNLSKEKLMPISRGFVRLIWKSEETPPGIFCISCGKEKVNLCTFCFVQEAKGILEENLGEGRVMNQFKEDFNADIWII